jgi:hypothetical protein
MREKAMKKFIILTSFLLVALVVAEIAPLYAQITVCGGPCTPTPAAQQAVSGLGWSFRFTRPCSTASTTSGGNGGGIEITNATYHGRTVFFKMHTPILNVQYQNNQCGPYRDWQWQESRFQCNGTVVAPGRCNGSATTNCANPPGGDTGNFCGVSVFTNNAASPRYIVLTSVVSAGWYRYQFEYYFYEDGSFRPAIKWTATTDSGCINNSHFHTIYWRIDFDIETGANNIIEENVYTSDPAYYNIIDPIQVEMKRMGDSSALRWWRVRNKGTSRAYLVYPPETYLYYIGPLPNPFDTDFAVDQSSVPFQIGDVWALRYNNPTGSQEETNECTGGLCSGLAGGFWAHLDRYVDQAGGATPASMPGWIDGQDIVFWYSARHMHQGSPTPPSCDGANGPYIVTDPAGPAW